MTPEGKLTAAVVRRFKKMIAEGEPLWYLKVHGSAMQRAGVPDFIGCYYGEFFAIELKADSPVSKRQLEELKAINHAQGVSGVCYSEVQVVNLLTLCRNRGA